MKKTALKVKNNAERDARRQIIEELFYDFNTNRHRVYLTNFVRGIFFGFGALLGGTLLVAIIIWILSQFAGWFPFIGDYINQIINAIKH